LFVSQTKRGENKTESAYFERLMKERKKEKNKTLYFSGDKKAKTKT